MKSTEYEKINPMGITYNCGDFFSAAGSMENLRFFYFEYCTCSAKAQIDTWKTNSGELYNGFYNE